MNTDIKAELMKTATVMNDLIEQATFEGISVEVSVECIGIKNGDEQHDAYIVLVGAMGNATKTKASQ